MREKTVRHSKDIFFANYHVCPDVFQLTMVGRRSCASGICIDFIVMFCTCDIWVLKPPSSQFLFLSNGQSSHSNRQWGCG